jgi:two-component system OmpR family response regulator
MTSHILIADDDPHIRDVIRFAIENAGMTASEVENGAEVLPAIERRPADLIVLDVGMPEMDGFEACKQVRRQHQTPILFLTARDDEIDRVLGFELGGDDYVSKPFSPRELVLRIRAILARGRGAVEEEDVQTFNDLTMTPSRHLCQLGDEEMALTGVEFSLLLTLLRAPERVLPRAQLITQVYGPNIHLSDRTIDSHIRNVRQKAASLGYEDIIHTVHGVGVKLGSCLR